MADAVAIDTDPRPSGRGTPQLRTLLENSGITTEAVPEMRPARDLSMYTSEAPASL